MCGHLWCLVMPNIFKGKNKINMWLRVYGGSVLHLLPGGWGAPGKHCLMELHIKFLFYKQTCNLFIGSQTFSCVLFRSSGCDVWRCLSAIRSQEDDLIHCRMTLHGWLKGRLWNLHLVTNATTALIRSDLVNDAKRQLYLKREVPGKAFCLLLISRFFFQSMKILSAKCLIHTQWACLHV